MNKLLAIPFSFLFFTTAMPASALNPEPVSGQNAEYLPESNRVKITAKTPTITEMDWDYSFTYEELDHISFVSVERHTPGAEWPSNAMIGRVENPAVGSEITFYDDNVRADQKYEYRLIVDVDGAKSYAKYVSVYTGVTPGALADFTASVESHTATAVDLSITAPSVDEKNRPLTSPMKIVLETASIYNREELHTFEDVAPGQTVTWRHEGLEIGHNYSYYAYAMIGSAGKGLGTETGVYVGLDVPGAPTDFTGDPAPDGLRLKWKAPAKGYYGGACDPASLTYTVKRVYNDGTETVVATGLAATEYLDHPGLGEMCAAHYIVTAKNSAGEGYKDGVSPVYVFGAPAVLPFKESFAGEKLDHKGWTFACEETDEAKRPKDWYFTNYGRLYYLPTDDYLTIEAQDGDEGFASCGYDAYTPDGCALSLISPAISVDGLADIDLSFFFYELPLEATKCTVTASISRDGGEWEQIWISPLPEGVEPGWKEVRRNVALNGNAAQVRLKFDGTYNFGPVTNMNLDNILVEKGAAGIADVTASEDTTTEYYNLQGIRLNGIPADAGIYIRRTGRTAEKVVVK